MKIEAIANKDQYQIAWRHAKGCFTQSWMWGEVKKATQSPLRYLVDDQPLQVLVRRLPFGVRFGYAPRAFSAGTLPLPKQLGEISKRLCQEQRLSHLVFEPNVCQHPCNEQEWLRVGFRTAPKTIQPRHSRLLDLRRSNDQLIADMDKDVRRRHRRAVGSGLILEEQTTSSGFQLFYQCLHEVSQRVGFDIHPQSYYQHIFEEFSIEKMVHIYVARQDEQVLYALLALSDNGIFRRLYGGPSLQGRGSDAAQFIAVEMLTLARSRGCHTMDLWGVAPADDPKHTLASVSRFKTSLGGEFVTYWPQLIWVADPLRYRTYTTLLRGRGAIQKLKRKH